MYTAIANTAIGSVASTITAIASVFTALGLLITALAVLLPILKGTKENKAAIAEVHVIVNQQRTDMSNYNRALMKALHNAGVDIPEDQSIDNG